MLMTALDSSVVINSPLQLENETARTYLKINVSAHGKAQNGEKAEHTRSM
jgi:hypothetical protein